MKASTSHALIGVGKNGGTFILEHVGEIMAAMMIYKYDVIIIADVRHYLTYMF